MRHSSYTTTADTYTHVMPTHSAEAVRTVAALFGMPAPNSAVLREQMEYDIDCR